MTIRSACLLCLLIVSLSNAGSQTHSIAAPKREVRAVWLTTMAGLDWPHTTEKGEQQSSLREIVRTLKNSNFNTIFFQVRARGDAYYRSMYEPWAENLTGTLGKDPGWDPLAFLLTEAHSAGIEVHAWFNVFNIRGQRNAALSVPPHPSRAHPEWTVNYGGEGWLDPGIPDVRTYLVNVAIDLVRNYDLDGINFDFVRYPGRDFADNGTYLKHGNGMARDQWRKVNVDRFVALCYDRLMAVRPLLKIGASPLGIFTSDSDPATGALRNYYQDALAWLKAGKIDYVSPQLYWTIGPSRDAPDFAALLNGWQHNASGRHVYAGIGAYKPEVARQIPAQIDAARRAGAVGQSFFRFENIQTMTLFNDRYETPALIPAMPWKDTVPPLPPIHVAVTELAANVFQVEWIPAPQASDGDHPQHYVVYRWPSPQIPFNDPRAIAAITPRNETVTIDTVRTPTGPTYSYAVAAIDKANNEGQASQVSSGTVKEFFDLTGKLTVVTALSTSLTGRGGTPQFIAYSLSHRTAINLSLLTLSQGAPDSVVATLANGVQGEGTYVVGLRDIRIGPGRYTLRLKTSDSLVEQSIDVSP